MDSPQNFPPLTNLRSGRDSNSLLCDDIARYRESPNSFFTSDFFANSFDAAGSSFDGGPSKPWSLRAQTLVSPSPDFRKFLAPFRLADDT